MNTASGRAPWFTALLLVLGGCTSVSTYRPDYVVPQAVSETERIEGRALVFTTPEEDAYVFSGHPTSFTGSASTLQMPIGMMTREIAVTACQAVFAGGAEHVGAIPSAASGAIVIHPRVKLFEYGYPQLKNLGFAITPEARVTVAVEAFDASGALLLREEYDSGVQEAGSYMVDFDPEERVSKLAHQQLYEGLRKSLRDIAARLSQDKASDQTVE